jgi:hypothetical protein
MIGMMDVDIGVLVIAGIVNGRIVVLLLTVKVEVEIVVLVLIGELFVHPVNPINTIRQDTQVTNIPSFL